MNNEDKILELLAESLRRLDKQDEVLEKHSKKLDQHTEILNTHSIQIQKLIDTQITQTDIMQRMAGDINELKNRGASIEDLEQRVSELEKYTGKK